MASPVLPEVIMEGVKSRSTEVKVESNFGSEKVEASDDGSTNFFNTDKIDRVTEVSDFATAKKEVLELKEQGLKTSKLIGEKKEVINLLKSELAIQDQKLLTFESVMHKIKGETSTKERHVKEWNEEYNAVLSKEFAEDEALDQRIQLTHVEFKLYDVKKDLAQNRWDLLKLEKDIKPQEKLVAELKLELTTENETLANLEEELDTLKSLFLEKYNAIQVPTADATLNLISQLGVSTDIIEGQQKHIESLENQLASVVLRGARVYSSESGISAGTVSSSGTQYEADIDDTLQALQNRISELEVENENLKNLKPFFQFGCDIRARKYEWDIKGRAKDQVVIGKGEDGIRNAAVLIDAILSTDPTATFRPLDFESIYNGVPASVVCAHMEFTMFHNILDWSTNMKKWGKTSGPGRNILFVDAFVKIFSKIYPTFKIGSNAALHQDEDLMEAYQVMSREHSATRWTQNPSNRPYAFNKGVNTNGNRAASTSK